MCFWSGEFGVWWFDGGAVGGAEDIAERSLEVFSSGSGLIGFPGPRLVRRVGHVMVTWLACHAGEEAGVREL